MKKIIPIVFILLFSQCLFAVEYPPSQSSLIKEFGQEYYDLRSQLPYDDAGYFYVDEALRKKEECLNILLKLLDDKTITTKKISLSNCLNINSSETIIYENDFIIKAIIELLIFSNGYSSLTQAVSDNFSKFEENEKILIKMMIERENIYYSIIYRKDFAMPKNCADILANYNYSLDGRSKALNEEVLKVYEKTIESGCIYVGLLSHYIDAIIEKGKYTNTQIESSKKAIAMYNTFFDKLPDKDLNTLTMLNLFQKITYLDKGKDNDRVQSEINKKIVKLVEDDRIKLRNQSQFVRKEYLRLLAFAVKTKKTIGNQNTNATIDATADANNTEVINTLKSVFKKRGNVFVLPGDEKGEHYEKLTDKEKEFLKMLEN